MRSVLLASLVILLAACPSTSTPGEQGPVGPQGPQGAMGAPGMNGAKGEPGAKGDKGDKGDTGDQGVQGVMGVEGPAGPQGLQGPAGQVIVIDGGVVTGPAGSSVLVTAITPGGATCPNGGVRITQLSDGGITNVCNGAPGATGAIGPQGPAGAQGASIAASVLPSMSPQCPTGGVLVLLPDAGTIPVCNGAVGAAGAQGPQGLMGPAGPQGIQGLTGLTGATGAQGLMGPAGPQGIQGLTGATGTQGPQGVPGMAGATGAQGPQGLQGVPGMIGPTGAQGPAGAQGPQGPTGPVGPAGAVLYLDGGAVLIAGDVADFAGFTVATYSGNLGGYPGANSKCAAEFPGSALCTRVDYDLANTTAAPSVATGAWIDYPRNSDGTRSAAYCYYGSATSEAWTYSGGFSSSSGQQGGVLTSTGDYTIANCNLVKPLACCSRR